MVPFYVFSLIVGGGFLALSVLGDLFGGQADADMGGDLAGFDGHLELDAGGMDFDAGGLDVDAGGMDFDAGGLDVDAGHLDAASAHGDLDADAGHLVSKVFSIRTLFYSLFGFGSVGTLLTYLWSGDPLLTAGFAILGGISSGAVVNAAFGYVKRSESGMLISEGSYAGLRGRVILPIRKEVPGRIVVERGGKRLELRALPHVSGEGDPSLWRDVFIVEMAKGVAQVSPIDEDMLLGP